MQELREIGSSSYSFYTAALEGVSGQRHASATLSPGKRSPPPGTHWVGGWVGLRAGLVTEAIASAGDRTPVFQSRVRNYTD
jgi:hypothetical protein